MGNLTKASLTKLKRFGNQFTTKYRNTKLTTQDGVFDSKIEYKDWCDLKRLEQNGLIRDLERQKSFELIPTIYTTEETIRKTVYKADFYYYDMVEGCWTAQDTKGFKTKEYSLKKKMFLHLYPNIRFIESGTKKKIYIVKK